MFLYQKGLLWISLYFVVSLACLVLFNTPENPEMEINASSYEHYLDVVRGPQTKEAEQLFVKEAANISKAKVELTKLYDSYYDGEISEEELQEGTNSLEKIVENERGFQLVFDQYMYVRENPENRYYLSTNGWDGLLSTEQLDLALLLLLLVLITPVFCMEFSSEMNSLHLTLRNGTRVHAVFKMLLVFLTVIVISVLSAMLQYGFFGVKYGLENGNYPLQSISYFGTSSKTLSLFSTFLLMTGIKIFGNLIFAMLIMFFSVWTKKYALTLFSSTVFILLPYYMFTLESSKYYLPGPLGFMISTGFFRGNEYERNPITDQMDLIFREVPMATFLFLLVITFCAGVVAWVVILNCHTNAWQIRKRRYRFESYYSLVFLCILVASLVGCNSNNEEAKKHDVFNSLSRQIFENETYFFYIDETDLEDIRPVFKNKETGEIRNLMLSPLSSLTSVESYIYGNGFFVYYMKMDYDKSGFYKETNRLSIIEVDTRTFEEKVIYEENANMMRDSFLGLHTTDNIDFLGITSFFVDKTYIYLVIDDNQIRQINRLTGRANEIIQSSSIFSNVAYDGKFIYYSNETYQIVKYDIETGIEVVIPDLITTHFIITDTEILYVNRQDNHRLYAMDLNNSTVQKLTDKPVWSFTYDNQFIYYTSKLNNERYRIDRNGQNETLLNEGSE